MATIFASTVEALGRYPPISGGQTRSVGAGRASVGKRFGTPWSALRCRIDVPDCVGCSICVGDAFGRCLELPDRCGRRISVGVGRGISVGCVSGRVTATGGKDQSKTGGQDGARVECRGVLARPAHVSDLASDTPEARLVVLERRRHRWSLRRASLCHTHDGGVITCSHIREYGALGYAEMSHDESSVAIPPLTFGGCPDSTS
jgi:hypothetical protein